MCDAVELPVRETGRGRARFLLVVHGRRWFVIESDLICFLECMIEYSTLSGMEAVCNMM